MDASEIKDKESLREWLELLPAGKVHKISSLLAYRCGLREMIHSANFQIRNNYYYEAIRLFKEYTYLTCYFKICGYNNIDYSAVLIAKPSHAAHTIDEHSNKIINNDNLKSSFWDTLRKDIKICINNINFNNFVNIHLWHGQENIPDEVNQRLDEWKKYHQKNSNEHWDIWIDFYEQAMQGKHYFFDDFVYLALIKWTDEQWRREPAVVNKEIKDLVDKYQQPKDINKSLSINDNIEYQEKDKQANLIKLQDSIKTDNGELLPITNQLLKEIDEYLSSLQSQKPNTDEAMEAWQNTYDFITRLKSHIMLLQDTIKAYQTTGDENALKSNSEHYQDSFLDNTLDMIDKIGRNKTIQGSMAIGVLATFSIIFPPAAVIPTTALSYAFLKAQGIEPNILNNIFKSKDK